MSRLRRPTLSAIALLIAISGLGSATGYIESTRDLVRMRPERWLTVDYGKATGRIPLGTKVVKEPIDRRAQAAHSIPAPVRPSNAQGEGRRPP